MNQVRRKQGRGRGGVTGRGGAVQAPGSTLNSKIFMNLLLNKHII